MVEVVFKARVFNRADMVWSDVEKDSYIKGQTIDSMDKIGLARNFHYKMGSTILNSLSHHVEKIDIFRRREGRFKEGLAIQSCVHS